MRDPKAIARAQTLRRSATDAERHLWQRLRHKQLHGYRFRRQVAIGHYFADFACLEAKLIIEVDGGQHAEQAAYDLDRTAVLTARGYRVLRFWNNDVLRATDSVVQVIAQALSPPLPPP